MIISIFVLDLHRNTKLYRSSAPMSSSKMNYYLTEFASLVSDAEGLLEKETYNYVYVSNNVQRIGMQTTKDHSVKQAHALLKHIEQNSTEDIFDTLFTIDNTLFGGVGVKLDLQPIKEMDSQDEKIHKMVLENKRQEMQQREKEHRMEYVQDEPAAEEKPQVPKPRKIERSAQPVLLVIREKVKIEMNRENRVKESSLSGEVDLVITDAKFRQLQIKMSNLKPTVKFSPYLDKNALKKQTLRFEKERGLNKNIPLMKWSGKCGAVPLVFEFWNDEEEGKIVNMVEFKAVRGMKEVEVRFNRESVSDVEIEGEFEETADQIVWRTADVKKDESRSIEIRCMAFDKDCLFPIEVRLVADTIESSLDVEKMMIGEEEVGEYEVRKVFETDEFLITAE